MKKLTLVFIAMAAVLAITPAAMADTYQQYSFSFATKPLLTETITGFGNFSVDLTTGQIIGVTGTITDPIDGVSGAIGSIQTNPASPFLFGGGSFSYDNKMVAGSLDTEGVYFTFDGGGDAMILSSTHADALIPDDGSVAGDVPDGGDADTRSLLFLDITKSPEPSSLLLLGTGLFGMAGMAFRRAKSTRRISNP